MKRLFMLSITVFLFSSFFFSCYYDSEEVLYPSFGCDSTNITYNSTIALTMDNYCTGCHGGSAPQGAISLTSYADVVQLCPSDNTRYKAYRFVSDAKKCREIK